MMELMKTNVQFLYTLIIELQDIDIIDNNQIYQR